jgi:predicted metal-dependent phosphoesterase TrpH
MTSLVVTIPEALAERVRDRQRAEGFPTPDAAAAALIGEALTAGDAHSAGLSDDELRRLIDEAEASGPAEPWDAASARAEVLRRYAARTAA